MPHTEKNLKRALLLSTGLIFLEDVHAHNKTLVSQILVGVPHSHFCCKIPFTHLRGTFCLKTKFEVQPQVPTACSGVMFGMP